MAKDNRDTVLGIDLGYSGALVVLNRLTGKVITWCDMPVRVIEGKRYINEDALIKWINSNVYISNRVAFAERVGARPGQGVSSMFRFGYGAGLVQGVLKTLGFTTFAVLPQTRKAAAGVSADKQTSLDLAQTIWPEHPELWLRAGWDGRAEAALIALYGIEYLLHYASLTPLSIEELPDAR